ncbi:MAG: hypothetical protein JW801_12540 [Bacteroidales bacterium]|nr:hypothetical protein [Bacteroidales bacterium]
MVRHSMKATLKLVGILSWLLMLPCKTNAADYTWWNEIHDWDGVTPWVNYLTISPAFLGPNAMPVPDFREGILPENGSLELSAENHFGSGDYTRNLYTEFYFPLYSRLAGLHISYVPIEQYNMDTITRDLRAARDYDGEGFSAGDFYVGTSIQIIRDKKGFPDVMISANIKTASGTNLEAARFNDTPGYYFDISFSKSFPLNEPGTISLRPFLLTGFYCWQTYRTRNPQNDAYMYGAGIDLDLKKLKIINSFGGYSGWVNDGDKPMVYRLELQTRFDSRLNAKLRFQHGFRDFPYTSVRLGVVYNLSPTLKKIRKHTLPHS